MLVVEGGADDAADMDAVAGFAGATRAMPATPDRGKGEGIGGAGCEDLEAGKIGHVEQDADELLALVEAAADGGAEADLASTRLRRQRAGRQVGNPDVEAFFAGGEGDRRASAAGLGATSKSVRWQGCTTERTMPSTATQRESQPPEERRSKLTRGASGRAARPRRGGEHDDDRGRGGRRKCSLRQRTRSPGWSRGGSSGASLAKTPPVASRRNRDGQEP